MVLPMLKPMIANRDLTPDLTAVLTFIRKVILISQCGIFWSSTSKVSLTRTIKMPPLQPQRKKGQSAFKALVGSCPPKEDVLARKEPFPHLLMALLPHPSSCRRFPFYTNPLLARWEAVSFTNILIKPIGSSHLLGQILILNMKTKGQES